MRDGYNYEHFPSDMDDPLFARFPSVLRVGERAPDGLVVDLSSGEPRALSQHWRDKPLMLEFGSAT